MECVFLPPELAMKLGNPYLHQFCICAVHSVVSPFVLQEIALEAGTYLSRQSGNVVVGVPGLAGMGISSPPGIGLGLVGASPSSAMAGSVTGSPSGVMGGPVGGPMGGPSPGGMGPNGGVGSQAPPSLHTLTHHLRSPMLSPLVQRCQQM